MVRDALNKREFSDEDRKLYINLIKSGSSRRVARQLQNLHYYCSSYGLDMQIVRDESKFFNMIEEHGAVVVIKNRRFCKELKRLNRYLIVDKSTYTLFIEDTRWHAQRYKL